MPHGPRQWNALAEVHQSDFSIPFSIVVEAQKGQADVGVGHA